MSLGCHINGTFFFFVNLLLVLGLKVPSGITNHFRSSSTCPDGGDVLRPVQVPQADLQATLHPGGPQGARPVLQILPFNNKKRERERDKKELETTEASCCPLLQLMTSDSHSLRVLDVSGCKVVTDEFLKPVFSANKWGSRRPDGTFELTSATNSRKEKKKCGVCVWQSHDMSHYMFEI